MEIMKKENVSVPSPALDRRTRCFKQKAMEAEMVVQEREGKKTFYLTLNNQGYPYRPRRRAWVVEVNKLSIALDPSCTHIRKQTYENMCLF